MTPTSSTDAETAGNRPDARHEAILEAALEVVAEYGYDRMTMDAVAARAHASKATIYRRWPGKAELVSDAMQMHVGHPDPLADTGDLRGDLHALIDHMRGVFAGTEGKLLFGLALACRSDPALGQAMSCRTFPSKSALADALVDRAEARGDRLRPDAATLIFEVAPGMAIFHQMNGREIDEDFVDHLVDDVLLPLLRAI